MKYLGAQANARPRLVVGLVVRLLKPTNYARHAIGGDLHADQRTAVALFMFRQRLTAEKNTDAAAGDVQKSSRQRTGLDVTDAQTAPLIDRDFQDARVEVFSSNKIVDRVGEVIESKRWFEPMRFPPSA